MPYRRVKLLAGIFGLSIFGLATWASTSQQGLGRLGCQREADKQIHTSESNTHYTALPVQPVITEKAKDAFNTAGLPPLNAKVVHPPNIELSRVELKKEAPQDKITLPRQNSSQALPILTSRNTTPPSLQSVDMTQQALPQAANLPIPAPVPVPTINLSQNTQNTQNTHNNQDLSLSFLPPLPNVPQLTLVPPAIPQAIDPQIPVARDQKVDLVPIPLVMIPPVDNANLPNLNSPPTLNERKEQNTKVGDVAMVVKFEKGKNNIELRSSIGGFIVIDCQQFLVDSDVGKGETPSSIKASGNVRFSTSGCKGSCEELVINPKTLEGTFRNAVKVIYTSGNTETQIMAEQMTFQLKNNASTTIHTPLSLPSAMR